ncbi:MAG: peptidase M1 [Phycisphaerae bacterium]|nr:MAG: peptidase M1 [Phycisphaerae bacterium]
MIHRFCTTLLSVVTTAIATSGCATSTAHIHAESYGLRLSLDPPQSLLTATALIHCRLSEPLPTGASKNLSFDIALHPQLEITELRCDKARVRKWRHLLTDSNEGATPVRHHRVTLEGAPTEFELAVEYSGHLKQDISAGEKRGEIHNFGMSAHVGTNGIYLSSGAWYPRFIASESDEDQKRLTHFDVRLKPVDDYQFVSSASYRNRSKSAGSDLDFESDFPQTGLTIVGGKYREWTRDVDGIRFAIMLNPENTDPSTLQRRADIFLDAAADYYHRYRPLVGPYPYDEFTIVENFFSSGFAFPTFTLLGPAVIAMEDRALRHGYLDHEFLHSWWGNGVYVDPTDGNWCEALTSFGANLYGYTLDGDAEGARKVRRDACNILTRISKKNDKPLDTFGQPEGTSRSIGYQKGAVVFDMIARKIGVDRFWQAMHNLTDKYTGQFVGWAILQEEFEAVSNMDFDQFFEQWVHGSNAPRFKLTSATIDNTGGSVEIKQDEPLFSVDLPLRIHRADGTIEDMIVPVSDSRTVITVDGAIAPVEVELDPDYHVARKLADEEILPTLGGSLRGTQAHLIAENDLWPNYKLFADDVTSKRKTDSTIRQSTSDAPDFAEDTVIIVGNAVRQPAIQSLIERSECPIHWNANGFEVNGVQYDSPQHSVLCTFRNPDAPGKTVTIYYGNSPESLSNAGILWFYGNSMLVYDAKPGGHAEVILRHDFESTQRIKFEK